MLQDAATTTTTDAATTTTTDAATTTTTDATTTTTDAATTTTAAATPAAAFNEADYNWQRAQTTAESLSFSIAFATTEGMSYDWGCVATSNSPVNPAHTSAVTTGTTVTPDPVVVDTGAAYLWSTMIMAIFLAVFMF